MRALQLYTYRIKVIRVIDGDTFVGLVDRGFKDYSEKIIRLGRINAPEVRGANKELGIPAKDFLEDALKDKEVIIESTSLDSFGRAIAEVWVEDTNVNDLLVEKKLAEYKNY